jgi:hypothetical protein
MSPDLAAHLASARQAALRLLRQTPRLRQEWLSGVHNPWGLGAAVVDPWLFLDICQSPEILDRAGEAAGEDLVLWDSELFPHGSDYLGFLANGREGRYWPADPLAGAVVSIALPDAEPQVAAASVQAAQDALGPVSDTADPLYVIRYMAGSSRYRRDAAFAANRIAMEEQVLINYATRPLWLLRGASHPGTDLVTGFAPAVPRWAAPHHRS